MRDSTYCSGFNNIKLSLHFIVNERLKYLENYAFFTSDFLFANLRLIKNRIQAIFCTLAFKDLMVMDFGPKNRKLFKRDEDWDDHRWDIDEDDDFDDDFDDYEDYEDDN